ncbi:dipeptide ABC transporter ATP-binding protein [Pseudonocardia sp. TRM90224]|uniref:dipeptide ABC transporter ATP-binding protein n=1 Tax=Pseudonocardia sp. TRM90224 TaxID=2812678 RepID=UPI001E346A9D|nr:dipeptide ABC transporter ATP-binding protein [Pseudonocardia sp. TRM90224]
MSLAPHAHTRPATKAGDGLSVSDLDVRVGAGVLAVNGVGFTLRPGEAIGLVGESGSGKSTVARAVLGLLPSPCLVTAGTITLDGRDMTALSRSGLRALRGARVAAVFQDPLRSLNPVMSIGAQLAEAVRQHHRDLRRRAVVERVDELLHAVGLREPQRVRASYPHQLSGGMRQRVAIAVALSGDPEVIVADEPTTALDVTTQAQVLAIFDRLRAERGLALLLISHDLNVVARHVDRIVVMCDSRVAESGPTAEVLQRPQHPYTQALLASALGRGGGPRRVLPVVTGSVPVPVHEPRRACGFAQRCPRPVAACGTAAPPLLQVGPAHMVACVEPRTVGSEVRPGASGADEVVDSTATPLLSVTALCVDFRVRGAGGARIHHAVRDVGLDLRPGETLAIVGESGSGKTTLGRAVLRLVEPTSGEVRWDGSLDLRSLGPEALRGWRVNAQMIFQDPVASFDPRNTVNEVLREAIAAHPSDGEATDAATLLSSVGLDAELLTRFPHELSGGQAQRVAIARALATRPRMLVLDEPTSSLDVSVQAQILNLLVELQSRLGLAYLFVTHDLTVVEHLAHRVAVMRDGELIEEGSVRTVFDAPQHPYTRQLLAAAPLTDRAGPPRPEVEVPAATPTPELPTRLARRRAPAGSARFWLQRVLLALFAAWGACTIVFLVTHLTWDPAVQLAGKFGTPEKVAEIRALLGYDQSLWSQYVGFLHQLITGNFPDSLQFGISPWEAIGSRVGPTLTLAGTTLVVIVAAGIGLGMIAGYHNGRPLGVAINAYIITAQAVPTFVVGPLLVLLFGVTWRVLPVSGYTSAASVVLPVITLAFYPVAEIALILRASIIHTVHSEHVTFARSKGLSKWRIAVRHVLRVALLPIITVLGFNVVYIFAGVVIAEQIFALPGLGNLLANALTAQDVPLVTAMVVLLALLVAVVNLLVDIAYRIVDPRLRHG